MLISEFSRTAGLTPDTVRFYVRRGLLKPETGAKGGARPYQIFTAEHVEAARMIKLAQSLGFSLKEIGALAAEYQSGALTHARAAVIMRKQLDKLDAKAAQLNGVIAYLRAKVKWLDRGGKGREPKFADYVD
jgi:DNA-binding transcriptional MerR regulator